MPAGGATIADLFGRLLLDDTGFQVAVVKSAEKAGDKAGATLGQRMSVGLKRGGAAVLGGLFLGAAASLTQLDDQVKRFQADVGATDEEAKSAAASTTRLYGAHRAGFDQILGTLAKLRTDQGLTEQSAEDMAGAYLDFANVAGGTGAQAVKGLDDILDAFNLSADKGVGIMDALVLSHQKYGGSINANVASLAALAPALQGLNLDVDDGIALLNLFEASGLDASAATRALNTAVKNLKPGQTFDDLISQISAIEDPTLRAQKVIEIFGVRGGTALAQALRPGITSLDQFGVSASDAAGATEAASKKIDSSIPAQFQLALQGIQGTLMNLLGPAGSVAQVIVGLTSLGAAFDILKLQAIAGWLAVLGPFALALGAAAAFGVAIQTGIDAIAGIGERSRDTAIAAGDLTGAQAALGAQVATTTDELIAQDIALAKVRAQQYEQANAAAIAAGATDAEADAAGKAAVANDKGADAAARVATEMDTQTVAALSAKDAADGMAGAQADAATAAAALALASAHSTGQLGRSGQEMVTTGLQAKHLAADVLTLKDYLDGLPHSKQIVIDLVITEDDRGLSQAAKEVFGQGGGGRFGAKDKQGGRVRQTFDDASDSTAKADAAAKEYARTVRSTMSDAFRAAGKAVDGLFDKLRQRRLDDIEDARRAANEQLEIQKQALFGPVDAAQAAFDAEQQRKRRADLQRSIAEAAQALAQVDQGDADAVRDAQGRLRDAREALQTFDEQTALDAQRAAAQKAADELTAQQNLNDAKAKADTKDANDQADADKKAFDDRFATLQAELEASKSPAKRRKVLDEIQDLYDKYGFAAEGKAFTSGQRIAEALADGLKSEVKAVEQGALALVAAIDKYIKLGSPAKAGPWSVAPPGKLGATAVEQFAEGMRRASAQVTLTPPEIGIAYPNPTALAGAGIAGAGDGRVTHVTNVDIGTVLAQMFGGPQFIRFVDSQLADLPGG